MKHLIAAALLASLAAASSSYPGQNHYRTARASAGAYGGVVNGQPYGGHYHTPDNGPTIFNRFGEHPPQSAFPTGGSFGGGHGNDFAGASSGAGAFAGGGAFGSSFPGPVTYAPQFPFVNIPPFHNPLDFNSFFQSYFKQLNENLAASAKSNKPHTSSSASSSISFSGYNGAFAKNFAYQQAAFEAAQNAFQATAHNRFGEGSGSYAPGASYGGAAASASFGPGGGHQAAGVFPANPASPNINTRFQSSGPKPGGNFGVSTSSFSSSSDVGGKKTSFKEASTTINDNGKVSTYTVRS